MRNNRTANAAGEGRRGRGAVRFKKRAEGARVSRLLACASRAHSSFHIHTMRASSSSSSSSLEFVGTVLCMMMTAAGRLERCSSAATRYRTPENVRLVAAAAFLRDTHNSSIYSVILCTAASKCFVPPCTHNSTSNRRAQYVTLRFLAQTTPVFLTFAKLSIIVHTYRFPSIFFHFSRLSLGFASGTAVVCIYALFVKKPLPPAHLLIMSLFSLLDVYRRVRHPSPPPASARDLHSQETAFPLSCALPY